MFWNVKNGPERVYCGDCILQHDLTHKLIPRKLSGSLRIRKCHQGPWSGCETGVIFWCFSGPLRQVRDIKRAWRASHAREKERAKLNRCGFCAPPFAHFNPRALLALATRLPAHAWKTHAYTCKQNTLNFLPRWTIRPSMVIFRGNTGNTHGSPSPFSRDWIPPIKKLLEDYLVTRPELHLFYLWLFVHWRSLRRKVASAKREV